MPTITDHDQKIVVLGLKLAILMKEADLAVAAIPNNTPVPLELDIMERAYAPVARLAKRIRAMSAESIAGVAARSLAVAWLSL